MTGLPVLALLLAGCGDGAPTGMVRLDGPEGVPFWIDAYEFPNRAGEKPATYANLEEARAACGAAGKRLCTAAEWRTACAGPDGARRYPYGPTFASGRCHLSASPPSGHTSMMDPDTLVTPAGTYPACRTPEGVWDLSGNVEEWVLDNWNGLEGMLEGGAWYTYSGYADCTGRYSREPDYRIDPSRKVFSAGFRCCWSEEAPDEAHLSQAARSRDAATRLASAPGGAPGGGSEAAYDPTAEIPTDEGTFIDTWEYPNRPGAWPRTGVTWTEADGLCRAAGKRLCHTTEWERACAGPEHAPFPYGSTWEPSACATGLSGPAPSGHFLACSTPAGVRDLTGSVWEWTADDLDVPGLVAGTGRLREIRGGSWFTDHVKSRCQPAEGYPAAREDTSWPDLGFRCCRGDMPPTDLSPHPGSLACPAGMVAIEDFCIDASEHPNQPGDRPTANLDLPGALAACTARGLRVCAEDEWTRACEGLSHRRWPYGDRYVPDRCRDEARARSSQQGEAAPSGSHPDCRTPEGVYDLSGNLWEWVLDAHGTGTLAGGGWNISAGLNQCTARAPAQVTFRNAETGTRCCGGADEIVRLTGGGGP